MKQIKVVIAPDGSIKVEALGYAGQACELDTKQLEGALGVGKKRTLKPERYKQTTKAGVKI